jgi:asparagine synthase (glutamine-hydrolysing)
MCGIAGLMTRDGRPPDQAVLDRLDRALAHRGPDGSGRHVEGRVGLVHRRLAIIDLKTGDQPFVVKTDGAATTLVANGEIYNYKDLKTAMVDVAFATQSDCEPALHLYLRNGATFARSLRGMYAIAIHDAAKGRLVLARDPFGIKPLYYTEGAFGFAFASEAQALVAAGLVAAEVRSQARDALLQVQFTMGGETIFAGIHRVLPGETLVVEKGMIVERHRIAALPFGGPVQREVDSALYELDEILTGSVTLHQQSDVPYGMFLSGGVDSATILQLMRRLNETPVQAFTAYFPGTDAHDERMQARAAARATGAAHYEVEFDDDDLWRLLPAVAAAMDDPVADYAILPSFKLAGFAREAGLKVILTGEGGDELFAGYGRYRRAARWRILGGRPMRDKGTFEGLGILRDESGSWREGLAAAKAEAQGEGRTPLQINQAIDCVDWLPNDLLVKLDRCLMAHGVEGRVPFLDPEVAKFAFLLTDRLKLGRNFGKWLLRRWLQSALPVAEPFARKKGFTVPVGEWISVRAAEIAPLVAAQDGIRQIVKPGTVEGLFAGAAKRHSQAAWRLLFYAVWHRIHVEGRRPEGASAFDLLAP